MCIFFQPHQHLCKHDYSRPVQIYNLPDVADAWAVGQKGTRVPLLGYISLRNHSWVGGWYTSAKSFGRHPTTTSSK